MKDGSERRRYMRHPLHFPIFISMLDSEPFSSGAMKERASDVSEGGLCFLWKHPIATDARVRVTIPVKDQSFEMKGRITYSRPHPTKRLYYTGLAFEDCENSFRLKLAEEILRIQQYKKKLERELNRQIDEEEAAQEWIKKHAENYAKLFPGSSR